MSGETTDHDSTPEVAMLDRESVDVGIDVLDGGVAVVEIRRPPNNYFDAGLIERLADATHALGAAGDARCVVLVSDGKHFCAGADFQGGSGAEEVSPDEGARRLYTAAIRLMDGALPMVAAVQGAAIGGGLGLALAADFRIGSTGSRFAANFSRLGLHHGFGLTVTLPRVLGAQRASDLLLTGRRIDGAEAYRIGLLDRLVEPGDLRPAAIALASEIATAAPLAVQSIRRSLRAGLAEELSRAVDHERAEQLWLRRTDDFDEGIRAAGERRAPVFNGR